MNRFGENVVVVRTIFEQPGSEILEESQREISFEMPPEIIAAVGGIQNPKRNGQEAENSLKDIDGGIIWILTNCSALIRGS